MAIITLKNVKLKQPIAEEDEDPLSLSSFGVDLPVDQKEIENYETDQIDRIRMALKQAEEKQNSIIPVLSDTLIKARFIDIKWLKRPGRF